MLRGKKAYICSPLSAPQKEQREQNRQRAQFYLMQMRLLFHCRTIASHVHLPLILDDTIPEEREAALQIGQILLSLCDVLIICGKHVSSGMEAEIKAAFANGMEVYWYDSIMQPEKLMKVKSWRDVNDEV